MYDVYASQQPLDEGEEKHIISVFVADESGIINRVAGVFARRGDCQVSPLIYFLSVDLFVAATAACKQWTRPKRTC